jgi:hypothetical protein
LAFQELSDLIFSDRAIAVEATAVLSVSFAREVGFHAAENGRTEGQRSQENGRVLEVYINPISIPVAALIQIDATAIKPRMVGAFLKDYVRAEIAYTGSALQGDEASLWCNH